MFFNKSLLFNHSLTFFTTVISFSFAFLPTHTLLSSASAQDKFIPRKQTQPPGPPLSPDAALAKMTVPEGFHVELVAAEPDLLNPVAMAFDDRGRIFVTESFEYPRHSAGPGRDRIKILEDTDNDGRVDSVKIFAEGLNIPSGIAVGHGGVWVANAPDILFLEDTDGDDRADKQTVVATGFGRADTHELPNALTWGPDGFLYGLNGVFNPSVVEQSGQKFEFTCALFRIDPLTRQFDLFCEGTSNPWGVTFDDQGSAFVSACVIDHFWHLAETGYYHRQGGPYPPHTWKIESIVDYQHQMAAYCGIEYFDSPAYPAQYRNKFYMGNIHGGCINVDSVARYGSTYKGTGHPDFLTANDVWFMPVAQKVGPDGCLYILDWYDRYHCYQDALADPEGIDRGHGRLYRVVFGERPQSIQKDLATLSDAELIALLTDANIFLRQRASVLLSHRLRSTTTNQPQGQGQQTFDLLLGALRSALQQAPDSPPLYLAQTTLHAPQLTAAQLMPLLNTSSPLLTSWAIQAAATRNVSDNTVRETIRSLAASPDPRVRLQVAIAANKMAGDQATSWLLQVLQHSQDDGLLPRIVWQNLLPHIVDEQEAIIAELAKLGPQSGNDSPTPLLTQLAPRIAARILADVQPNLKAPADVQACRVLLHIASTIAGNFPEYSSEVIEILLGKLQTGEIRPEAAQSILAQWFKESPQAEALVETNGALVLRCYADDTQAIERVAASLTDNQQPVEQRVRSLKAITSLPTSSRDEVLPQLLSQWIKETQGAQQVPSAWQTALLEAIIEHGAAATRSRLVQQLPKLPIGLQATIAERLSQREVTALLMLDSISKGNLSKDIVGPNQVRLLAAHRSESVRQATAMIWGTVRLNDSQERQQVIRELNQFLTRDARGDAARGIAVYDRICGQCHQMHDRGFEVGPNITRNGRGSFEQLLVSVFDPSSVIGEAYKSVTVLTQDGRVLNGIVAEQSDQRIILKLQGGKEEIVPTAMIDEVKQNPQSLMPEGLEQQMTRAELADLFALLTLEQPPGTRENSTISGTPQQLHSP